MTFNAVGVDTSFKAFAPTCADGYKIGHAALYPKGTDFAYGNCTPRSDKLFLKSESVSKLYDHKVVWVGVQGVLREVHGLWQRTFFGIPKERAVSRYKRTMKAYLGNENANAEYLGRLWDVGYLPVTVLSIDEGERLDIGVPGYVIYATGEHFWIYNYLETIMSSLLWKIVTNATIAYEYRRVFDAYAKETGVDPSFAAIQGHDFSFRGVGGYNDAASSGFGHLVSFAGTDTIPAIDYAEEMYGADVEKEFVACSVVATEHAVATSNILYQAKQISSPYLSEKEILALSERAFIKRVITEVHPSGVVSLVSDSFDFWKIVSEVLPSLRDEIMARTPDANGLAKVVCRPDSGDPVEILCGLEVFSREDDLQAINRQVKSEIDGKYHPTLGVDSEAFNRFNKSMLLVEYDGKIYRAYFRMGGMKEPKNTAITTFSRWLVSIEDEPLTPQEKGAVEVLWDAFGGTVTEKGFKVLCDKIGLIYGDSITVKRAEEILRRLKKKGFASCNTVFGIGSYTYQYSTRDLFGIAMKATACRVNGEVIELYKAPATETNTLKKSAKGFLKVVKEGDNFKLLQQQDISVDSLMHESGELKPVYQNGVFLNPVTHSVLRARLLK